MRFFTVFVCIFSIVTYISADTVDSQIVGLEENILINEDDSDLEAEPVKVSEDAFWFALSPETAMYSNSGFCLGTGLALAYGKRISIGFRAAYFIDFIDRVDVLELGFFLRFYALKSFLNSGLFVQLSGGHALFISIKDGVSVPAQWGTMYGGADVGWRFRLGKRFFLEPFVRGGYPYLFGAGLSAGAAF